jgi:hypothetical protein
MSVNITNLKQQIDDVSLQVLLLSKMISDNADRKDQLDQVVRVLDLLSLTRENIESGDASEHG